MALKEPSLSPSSSRGATTASSASHTTRSHSGRAQATATAIAATTR